MPSSVCGRQVPNARGRWGEGQEGGAETSEGGAGVRTRRRGVQGTVYVLLRDRAGEPGKSKEAKLRVFTEVHKVRIGGRARHRDTVPRNSSPATHLPSPASEQSCSD